MTNTQPQTEPAMNANEINFGVELETTVSNSRCGSGYGQINIGGYHRGTEQGWLPRGWKAERDGSITSSNRNRRGCEFVSPVMKGEDGLNQITTACRLIKEKSGQVNHTCGVHVTVAFPTNDAAALARLINLVANHERALYAITGTKRREEAGRWCKAVKGYGDDKRAKRVMDHDRYHLLNLTHLARGNGRVEFRVFSGSLNDDKVRAWVQVCLGLVALALSQSRRTSWNYEQKEGKRGPWNSRTAGRGETEMNRLFYRLGWTKGHTPKAYGLLDENAKAAKKALRGMAKKYDAEA